MKTCRYYPPILLLMALVGTSHYSPWAWYWAAGMGLAGWLVWQAGEHISNAPWE